MVVETNNNGSPWEPGGVILGVDTHEDEHVAVALDPLGRRLRDAAFPATKAGYRRLLRWGEALGDGTVLSVGVEGTGSYGVGLARFLLSEGARVLEVDRPNRQHRRAFGKSDTTDAEAGPPGRFSLVRPKVFQRARTARWRRSAPCGWHAVRR